MKICTACGKENFDRDDVCERCNQSIQNINHETFHLQDHILKLFSIIAVFIGFIKGVDYLEDLNSVNIPLIYFQAIRITAASAIIIVLIITLYSSSLYDNPKQQIAKKISGEFFVYLIFNITLILGIVVFIGFPDKNGITLFPSLLFYLAIPGSFLLLMKNQHINKQKIISWFLIFSIWFFEIFLIGHYAVLIFAKYGLNPELWWSLEIGFLSLFFLVLGLFIGSLIACCLAPPFNPFDFVNYLLWSNPNDFLLDLAFYGGIYIALVSPAIWQIINYFAA
ncbi:zinc finger Ran-binding domain-containing protein [Methanoregula sp. UBA64]|jgi:hypothetical protein|uniref:zinc finger Ran-binding domain-containing protein n=1 Tax=Methanoregula sp. UBA64 TaxID=1915554 RepID=UPI0025D3E9AB|nr:zinc finger Ran-binding domain-containing protein [Methanoregula sp. UBA64]